MADDETHKTVAQRRKINEVGCDKWAGGGRRGRRIWIGRGRSRRMSWTGGDKRGSSSWTVGSGRRIWTGGGSIWR